MRETEGGYSGFQREKVLLFFSPVFSWLFDGEVGELLVHRRIINLLQSKHISHELLC